MQLQTARNENTSSEGVGVWKSNKLFPYRPSAVPASFFFVQIRRFVVLHPMMMVLGCLSGHNNVNAITFDCKTSKLI